MRYNNEWKNYKILGTGAGYKLEDFGGVVLLRPDPQIIWQESFKLDKYKGISATYKKDNGGGWEKYKDIPDEFCINWRNLVFSLKLMNFKHTGVFPEQAYNWARIIDMISNAGREINVLNLFAYTGGATLAAASAGAKVCHVDSSKAMCERAGKNARLSGLADKPIRYIVDDCIKFVEREVRRGNKYHAIIMDPPSYGRGVKGEMWKFEDKIVELIELTQKVMAKDPLFYLVNSYTAGLQPAVIKNILEMVFKDIPHTAEGYSLGIPTMQENIILPCGSSVLMEF